MPYSPGSAEQGRFEDKAGRASRPSLFYGESDASNQTSEGKAASKVCRKEKEGAFESPEEGQKPVGGLGGRREAMNIEHAKTMLEHLEDEMDYQANSVHLGKDTNRFYFGFVDRKDHRYYQVELNTDQLALLLKQAAELISHCSIVA